MAQASCMPCGVKCCQSVHPKPLPFISSTASVTASPTASLSSNTPYHSKQYLLESSSTFPYRKGRFPQHRFEKCKCGEKAWTSREVLNSSRREKDTRNDLKVGNQQAEKPHSRRVALLQTVAIFTLLGAGFALPVKAGGLFGLFGPADEKDPVEPFTFYGTVVKKYLIENIVDGRVVGRKRGFTASICVNAVEARVETPEFQGLPVGMRVNAGPGEPSCAKGEGQTREESCDRPCEAACASALARHLRIERAESGYALEPSDQARAKNSCTRECQNECYKPGKSIAFVVPIRY